MKQPPRLSVDAADVILMLKHTINGMSDTQTAAALADLILRDIAVHNDLSFQEVQNLLLQATEENNT